MTNHFKHLLLQRVKLIHTKAITVTAFASLTPCCVRHPSLRSQCCSSSKWKHTQTHTRTHTDETTFWAHSLLIHLALPSAHTPTQTAPVWNQGHLWCWHLVCVCTYMCVQSFFNKQLLQHLDYFWRDESKIFLKTLFESWKRFSS